MFQVCFYQEIINIWSNSPVLLEKIPNGQTKPLKYVILDNYQYLRKDIKTKIVQQMIRDEPSVKDKNFIRWLKREHQMEIK